MKNICINLCCDNKFVIGMGHNPVQHDRTNDTDKHFMREKLDYGVVKTAHVSSSNHTPDIFTKGSSVPAFKQLISKFGLENIHAPT